MLSFRDVSTHLIEPVNSISTSTSAVKAFDDDVIVIEDLTDDEMQHKRLDHSINCCGVMLKSCDLNTLQPSRWLNDQVCMYILYIQESWYTLLFSCIN